MKKIDLVLVEDNPHDAHILMRILKKEDLTESIVWLKDGEAAVDNLIKEEKWLPKLILLDIKLPKVNGLEILSKIRQHKTMHTVPVLMLTSSNQTVDIEAAYNDGANAFLTKPKSYNDFKLLLKTTISFWLNYNLTVHDS